MLGLIQKILLTIVSIVIALTMAFGFYVVIFEENNKFEYNMLILLALAVFGVLSFVFHIKTIGFYKHKNLESLNYNSGKPFWVFNLAFVGSLFFLACFFLYLLNKMNEQANTELLPFLIFITVPILVGVWLLLDARYLYRNHKILEAKAAFNTIDDIKGVKEKEDE
jgi:uncharacterized membrane protein